MVKTFPCKLKKTRKKNLTSLTEGFLFASTNESKLWGGAKKKTKNLGGGVVV